MKRSFLLLVLIFSVVVATAPALADGDFYVVAVGGGVGTKITSLPYTINSPGFYYITSNLSCEAKLNGITVNSDNVTIDLMGFRLTTGSSNKGVYMSGRKNVEIRNGTLQGWIYAIHEDNESARNHRVINVRALGNGNGIILEGVSHLVKGCLVSDCNLASSSGILTGASSTISGNQLYNCTGWGIKGTNCLISDNTLHDCAIGISGSGTIRGNVIYNSTNSTTGISSGGGNVIGNYVYNSAASQTGIRVPTVGETVLDQNTVTGYGTHYLNDGPLTVWAAKSTYNPWGSNAGHTP